MNISRYIKEHESWVKRQLINESGNVYREELHKEHAQKIAFMQHERLVHLLVTLAFGAFLLATTLTALFRPFVQLLVLGLLFLILFIPYLIHYFFLENAIQRWYLLMDEIDRLGKGNTADSRADSAPIS